MLGHPDSGLNPAIFRAFTEIYGNKLYEICDLHKGNSQFYTDNSKVDDRVASAVFRNNTTETTHLPNGSSICRAEMCDIMHALTIICCDKDRKFIIFSDSVSNLEAVSGFKLDLGLLQNIFKDYTYLANSGQTIVLCWILTHVNI